METISNSMLNEESRRKEKDTNFQYEANVIKKSGRGETRGRIESRGRNKSITKGRSQSCIKTTICYYCRKEGHKRFECIFLKRDQKTGIVHPDLVDLKNNDYSPTQQSSYMMMFFLLEKTIT